MKRKLRDITVLSVLGLAVTASSGNNIVVYGNNVLDNKVVYGSNSNNIINTGIFKGYTYPNTTEGLAPVGGSYSSERDSQGTWYYSIDNASNTVDIVAYVGTAQELTIPTTLGGRSVRKLSDSERGILIPETPDTNMGILYGNTTVKKVTVPNGVALGDGSFQYSSHLEEVVLQNNITTLPDVVFGDCNKLQKVSGLGNVNKINYYSFANCYMLWDLDLRGKDNNIEYGVGSFYMAGRNIGNDDIGLVIDVSAGYEIGAFNGCVFKQLNYYSGANMLGTPNNNGRDTGFYDSRLKYFNILSSSTSSKNKVNLSNEDFTNALIGVMNIETDIEARNALGWISNTSDIIMNIAEGIDLQGVDLFKNSVPDVIINAKTSSNLDLTNIGKAGTNIALNSTYNGSFGNCTVELRSKGRLTIDIPYLWSNFNIQGLNVNLGNKLVDINLANSQNNLQLRVGDCEIRLSQKLQDLLTINNGIVPKIYKVVDQEVNFVDMYNFVDNSIASQLNDYTMPAEKDFTYLLIDDSTGTEDRDGNLVANDLFDYRVLDFNTVQSTITIPSTLEFDTDGDVLVEVKNVTDAVNVVLKDAQGNVIATLDNIGNNIFNGTIKFNDSLGAKDIVVEVIDTNTGQVISNENMTIQVNPKRLRFIWDNIEKFYDGTTDANVTLDNLILETTVNIDKSDLIEIVSSEYRDVDVGTNKDVSVELTYKDNKYVLYDGNREIPTTPVWYTGIGTIKQTGSGITDTDVQYNQQSTYGDTIEIKVKPSAMVTNRALDTVELWKGNTLLATSNRKDGDYYVIEYNTSDKKLEIGNNNLTLRFTGNNNMLESSKGIVINLQTKEVQATYDLQYEYDGLTEKQAQLNVINLVGNDTLDIKATLTLDRNTVNVGDTPVVNNISYTVSDVYYSLPVGNITGNITITKVNTPNGTTYQHNVTVKNKEAKSYTIDIPLDAIYANDSVSVSYGNISVLEHMSGYLGNQPYIVNNKVLFDINNVNSDAVGNIASISFNIESTNYNDVFFTLELMSSNKDVPVLTVKPIDTIYGTIIDENLVEYKAVDANGNTVEGTITVVGGGLLDAGNHTVTVEFTPLDTNTYDSVTVQVNVNVGKGTLTMQNKPVVSEPNKIENTLKDFTFTDNGEFVDKDGNVVTGVTIKWVDDTLDVVPNKEYEFIVEHPNYTYTGTLIPYPTDKIPMKYPSGDTVVFPDGSLVVGTPNSNIDVDKGTVTFPSDVEIELVGGNKGDKIEIVGGVVKYPSANVEVELPKGEVPTFDKDINLILPDGSKYPTNKGEAVLPNGGIVLPDGTVKPNFPILIELPGGELELPDGVVLPMNPGYTKDPNGNIVINVPNNVLDKLPGGCDIILKPNGEIEYKPNGIIDTTLGGIVEDSNGNKVTDVGKGDTLISTDTPIKNGAGSITLPSGGVIIDSNGNVTTLPPGSNYKPNTDTNNNSNNNNTNNNDNSSSTGVIINQGNDNNKDKEDNGVIIDDGTKDVFTDIGDEWYSEAIRELHKLGVVNGYLDGTFRPNAKITRADFSIMVYNVLEKVYGQDLSYLGNTIYTDIKNLDYYYDKVMALSDLGIVKGYGNGTFKPTQNISREEATLILDRLVKYIDLTIVTNNLSLEVYKDYEDIAVWAKEEVESATKKGLIMGYEDSTFRPKGKITRAETAQLLYNLLKI